MLRGPGLLKLFQEADPDKPLHLTAEEAQAVRMEGFRQQQAATTPVLNRRQRRALGMKGKRRG